VGGYAARRDWLRENRETAVRFLQALLMAYDVLQKDPGIGVRTVATEMGIKWNGGRCSKISKTY
jgi:ABC-type nitrate/sulfonate/bicarbonate transport system substrate-binding protein